MAGDAGRISLADGEATIDATLVAKGLRIEPAAVPEMIREGRITCAFERGMDEDEGRFRMTFWHGRRQFRIVVDKDGNVLQRQHIDHGEPPPRQSRSQR